MNSNRKYIVAILTVCFIISCVLIITKNRKSEINMENEVLLSHLVPDRVEITFLKNDNAVSDMHELTKAFQNKDIEVLKNKIPTVSKDFDFQSNYEMSKLFEHYMFNKHGFKDTDLFYKKLELYLMPMELNELKCFEVFFHEENKLEANLSSQSEIDDYEGNYLVLMDKSNSQKFVAQLVKDKILTDSYLKEIQSNNAVILMKLKN